MSPARRVRIVDSCRNDHRGRCHISKASWALLTVRAGSTGKFYDNAERARWHAMLIWIGQERDYKAGWVAHKYREKFGVFPAWGAAPEPIPPTPEIRSWVRSRNIAFAKRQVA